MLATSELAYVRLIRGDLKSACNSRITSEISSNFDDVIVARAQLRNVKLIEVFVLMVLPRRNKQWNGVVDQRSIYSWITIRQGPNSVGGAGIPRIKYLRI